MSARSAPTSMSEQNLLATIRQIFPDLEVDMKDIKNPTQAFIGNFYALFLTDFGADVNELSQIQMRQMTTISHVDMYSQTIPHINMYEAVNFFYKSIGINDFYFSDLVNPQPKRTVVQLSAIMNFLQHCDSAVHEIQDSIEQLKLQKTKKEELLSKIESSKEDINRRATNRAQRNGEIKQLEKAIEKDKLILDEVFKEKEVMKQTLEEVKRIIALDDQRELELIKTISGLKEENEKLSDMIVKSPDKLKNEWRSLEERKDDFISQVKGLQEQIEEKKKLTNLIINESREHDGRVQRLRELLEMEKSIEEMNNRVESLRKKHAELVEEIEELRLQNANILQNIKAIKASLEELKARKLKQDVENKDALEAIEKEYQSWSKKCREKFDSEDKLLRAVQEVKHNMRQLDNDISEFNDYLQAKYEKFCGEEREIIDRFEKILEVARRRNQNFLEDL